MGATVAVYAPHVREAGLVYEDANDLDTQYLPWQGWRAELHSAAVKPARVLSSAVTRLVGFDAPRQHAASLALHLLCAVLLWQVALTWLGPIGAFVTAGVWLLHPVQVDAVAYLSARPDVLVALCVLLGLLAVQADLVGLAWLCAAAAVLCKESGVVAFLLLPLAAWWTGMQWPPRTLMAWGLSVTLPVGIGLLTLDARMAALSALQQAWATLGWLLSRLIWPVALTIDPAPTLVWMEIVPFAVAVALLRRRPSWLGFGVAWALVALLPRFVLPLHEGPHVAHLYIPMIGMSLVSGSVMRERI